MGVHRVLALATAITALAVPGAAVAAAPPTILSAGIDAEDRLYVTWSLGEGTTYDHAGFATSPESDPLQPGFFDPANVAVSGCPAPPDTCTGTPTSTAFRSGDSVARDRRYFVKVTAIAGKGDYATSPIWVVDETKPQKLGKPPGGPTPATNIPAIGRPYMAAPAPSASVSVLSLPTTVSGLRTSGARLRVTCKRAPCTLAASLAMNGRPLRRFGSLIGSGTTRTVVLKPTKAGLERLRGRSRTQLKITAAVTQKGETQRVERRLIVRR
ncbi:MAG: hypothetical protein H0W96_14180 [Solirubrobacterales bacterium]|nr:hypothetical protein [Solirubrobacterales bacterium]